MNHTVSVIIPVLNDAFMLRKVLEALTRQSYPKERIEVIVIDNGSTDNSKEVAETYGVLLLQETEKKSPYAARNLGFKQASGSVIALTDANKVPDRYWIEEGVKAITEKNADLAGGEIKFDLGLNPSSAELFDAMTYNDNRTFVLEQKSSAAGNLFLKRGVLKKAGRFPDRFRSGMDIWWTQKAVQKGCKLVFSDTAIVYCKPRTLFSLLKKSYRVGVMHPVIFQQKGHGLLYILDHTFRTFAPPRIKKIRGKMLEFGKTKPVLNVWCVAWLSRIMMGFGRIRGFVHLGSNVLIESEKTTPNSSE